MNAYRVYYSIAIYCIIYDTVTIYGKSILLSNAHRSGYNNIL